MHSTPQSSLSLYSIAIIPALAALENLRAILAKAETFAKARGDHEQQLLDDRIVFDQFALKRQVQIASDNARSLAANLAGVERPKMEDTETTFAELIARVDASIAFVRSIPKDSVDGQEAKLVPMPYHAGKAMAALDYATRYLLPNFYFHVVTAYDILRKNGLLIGKSDFLGSLPLVDTAA